MATLEEIDAELAKREGGFALADIDAELARRGDDSTRRDVGDGVDSAGAGIEQVDDNLIAALSEGFKKIPGAPELSEFAAGVNRSVAGVVDFLGPDTINSILSLSGSERKVPTLTETLPGIEGGFVEPGLKQDVLSTAGETAPLALGIGSLLRNLASKAAPIVAGTESTAGGLLKQAAQTTPQADVALGSIAGAGQAAGGEIGEQLGGESGREAGELIGGVVAPVAVIPVMMAKSSANKLLKQAAPSIDELKTTARGIYKSLDESGFIVPSKDYDKLVVDISSTLKKEGLGPPILHPKANGVLREMQSQKGADKTLTEIDTLRKVAQAAASSIDASERRLGKLTIDKIDDFLDKTGQGEAFESARGLWHRAKKAELLDFARVEAESQASGIENGIRIQFRALQKKINKGKVTGFTEPEKDAIKKVVDGTLVGNITRAIGKFGIMDGVTTRSLTTLSGAGLAGAATGSPIVAAGVPLAGQLSGALARRMTENNANMTSAITRAGKNGIAIMRVYMKNTPKAERDPQELAQLLLKNEVPVESINPKKSPLILTDAAILASLANQNDKREENGNTL